MKKLVVIALLVSSLSLGIVQEAEAARRWRACVNNDTGALVVKRRCSGSESELPTVDDLGAFNVGISGTVGEPGVKGSTGPTGPKGATGPAGAAGPDGVEGDQGSLGPQGGQGLPGDQGDQGDPGAAGGPGSDSLPMNVTRVDVPLVTATEIADGASVTVLASCPGVQNVIGGSCVTDNENLQITANYPPSNFSWNCAFTNLSGSEIAAGTSGKQTASVLCVDLTS